MTVDWGSTGMQGEVRVVETNACAPGEPVSMDVDIHPLPTSAISGLTTVGENSTGNVYTVLENSWLYLQLEYNRRDDCLW